jgi:hypothetical protein
MDTTLLGSDTGLHASVLKSIKQNLNVLYEGVKFMDIKGCQPLLLSLTIEAKKKRH